MSNDEPPRSIAYNPLFWGWFLSAILAVLYLGLAFAKRCKIIDGEKVCNSNFVWFTQSAPNEIGDTLAGLAGVLAFLWIIITVMLQSQELSEQRKELRNQRRATEDMARAQEQQVELLIVQQKYLVFEHEQNKIKASDQRVEQLTRSIKAVLQNWHPKWVFTKSKPREQHTISLEPNFSSGRLKLLGSTVSLSTKYFDVIAQKSEEIEALMGTAEVESCPNKQPFIDLIEFFEELSNVSQTSSLTRKLEVEKINPQRFQSLLVKLVQAPIWKGG